MGPYQTCDWHCETLKKNHQKGNELVIGLQIQEDCFVIISKNLPYFPLHHDISSYHKEILMGHKLMSHNSMQQYNRVYLGYTYNQKNYN